MRRRDFITLIGGAAAAWPLVARAQQTAKMKRIAIVAPLDKVSNMTITSRGFYRAFFEALGALGYAEGQNLLVERYSAEGKFDRFAELARDVVSTRPDLIVTFGGPLAQQFKRATRSVPLIILTADPIVIGLVPSLSHPGGNITGVSVDAGMQIWGKRLGLLIEAIPSTTNTRFLSSQFIWERKEGSAVREAANRAGISLAGALMSSFDKEEYQRVFTSMKQDQVDGLVVSDDREHMTNQMVIVELAAKNRLPAIYPDRQFAEVGGLLAYSADLGWRARRIADIVDKVLKGTNPGDIPIFQPTKFELAINLKTAKSLGLEIPTAFLASADFVVE
jgi:putative ABC transport system substrate-binding protein